MIYITGDTHADFSRFTKRQRCRLPFELTEKDIVIVCGDFGLLWVSIPIEISILFGNSEHPFPERKNMPFRSRVQPFI